MLVAGGLGTLRKIAFVEGSYFSQIPSLQAIDSFMQTYTREMDIFFGMGIVMVMLIYAQLTGNKHVGWDRLQEAIKRKDSVFGELSKASTFPALVMGWCLLGLSVIVLLMIFFNPLNLVLILSLTGAILILGGVLFLRASRDGFFLKKRVVNDFKESDDTL